MGLSKALASSRRGFAVVVAILAVTVAACGDDATNDSALGDDTIKSVSVVVEGGDFENPIDATLSPDGKDLYFIATNPQGPGVFRVPADGGTAVAIATGAPFRAPVGIATDGTRIYAADPEARGIFSLPVSGGRPTIVPGTEGSAPRGLEVSPQGGSETLFFTGHDQTSGAAGVFTIPAAGGPAPATVAKGSPLVSPDAVTVDKRGTVYVTDRGKEGTDEGAVFRITPTATTKLAGMRAPVLAGVTLTLDESLLLVSSLSDKGTDQVLLIDLDTTKTGVFSKTIGANHDGAGLHRARNVNVFAWADVQRPGRVYRIEP